MSSATRVPKGFYQATELQDRAQETSSANSGIGYNESSNKTQQSETLPTVTQQASLSLDSYPPEFRQNTRNFRPDSVSAPVSKIKFASSVSLQAILLEGDRLRSQQNVGRSFSIPRFLGYSATNSVRDFDRFSSSVVQLGIKFTNKYGHSESYNSSGIVIGQNMVLTTAHTFLTPDDPLFEDGCKMQIWVEGTTRIASRLLGCGVVGQPTNLLSVLGNAYVDTHGSLDPRLYRNTDTACVVETLLPVSRRPILFCPRRAPLCNLPTTVIAVNTLPDFEDIKKLYTDTEVDEDDLEKEAARLRPEEISGGPGEISHYCTFVEEDGPPKVRRDVPLADGPFLSYKISTLPGSSGGLVVRGGVPAAMHLGSNGGAVGKVTKDTVGYGLALDCSELQKWLSGLGVDTTGDDSKPV